MRPKQSMYKCLDKCNVYCDVESTTILGFDEFLITRVVEAYRSWDFYLITNFGSWIFCEPCFLETIKFRKYCM